MGIEWFRSGRDVGKFPDREGFKFPSLQPCCRRAVLYFHFTLCYITLYRRRQTSVLGIAGKSVVGGVGGMWFGTHPRLTPNRAPVKRGCIFFSSPRTSCPLMAWRLVASLALVWEHGNTDLDIWGQTNPTEALNDRNCWGNALEYIQFKRKPDWWKDLGWGVGVGLGIDLGFFSKNWVEEIFHRLSKACC